ncbi:MAG: DNA-directed DNA polymerase II large subunit [Methanomicrobiales archaeon]|nr:DNA-directed DNA polymerase II large subunit [Methanomicrobiales archaeon]
MELSPSMQDYFSALEAHLQEAIGKAKKARACGRDPQLDVEVPLATDLAGRVEALLMIRGVSVAIREREANMSREEASLTISEDFVNRRFGEERKEEILEHAIRTAMAILTEGVVAAPTEGIAKVGIGKNDDGSEYLKIYYAGPIRSAGGTAQALSVLVGDFVRRSLGIGAYKPRQDEIERYIEEIRQYNSRHNLQYLPSEKEIRLIVSHCPVCVDGEATEDEEVSGYRNLERVETNSIRGGMALVIAEGIAQKAPKVQKHVKKLGIDGWDWLRELSGAAKGPEENGGIQPRDKYLRDIIGGRPVFAHPMRKGGFRLRYGRSRNCGLAAAGLNPATMHLLGKFLAVGTQMKIERPGKAAGISPVDSIEGPTVRLKNGDVLRIDALEDAVRYGDEVEAILDVGEILISYGEFLENNHPLVPAGYCEEWWLQEGGARHPDDELEALGMALEGAPLHPSCTYLWEDLTVPQITTLADFIIESGTLSQGWLVLPLDLPIKALLEELLVPHQVRGKELRIPCGYTLLGSLGLTARGKRCDTWETVPDTIDPITFISHLSGFRIRPRGGTRIGGRMGRPGKSKPREMSPPPHALFPLGNAGGSRRSFQEAQTHSVMANSDSGFIEIEIGERRCEKCGSITHTTSCICGGHTVPVFRCSRCRQEIPGDHCPRCHAPASCSQKITLNVKAEYAAAMERLGIRDASVQLVKGVKLLMSRERCAEPIEKGILRSKNGLFVFKDGTIRYDMIDLPLTHFRPQEIGTSVEVLRTLGYTQDIHGVPLTDSSQVLELRPQDILVSEKCGDYLVKVAGFLDELLGRFYGISPFYRVQKREDLVGHLLVGLAPHTSAGVLARLIGFSQANVGYAHPFFHAAKRRNCFQGDTRIEVHDGNGWKKQTIRQFVLENFDLSTPGLDRVGTYYSDPRKSFFIRSIDTAGAIRMRRVTSVSVHKSPQGWIRFETDRKKSIVVTPEHAMLVWELNYLKKIVAMEVKVGDCVPVFAGPTPINERIAVREILPATEPTVYCLTVEVDHTMEANGIFTGQCDGDEDCVMLLLDCLINFSRSYLPETRGGTMDAPLVITSRIDPMEIDKESHNLDVGASYPRELYEKALTFTHPKEIEKSIDRVEGRLGTFRQMEGFLFTHDTTNISAGPLESTYQEMETMQEKLTEMLRIARIIRAVDADDVAERVLNTHFIPDLMGNLRAFSNQSVRCSKCNQKYRRIPLSGKCLKCGGNIIPTVHEASVKKYLEISRQVCRDFRISEYTRQRIEAIDLAIQSTFEKETEQQLGLADFM